MPKYLRVVPKGDKWATELDGEELATYDTRSQAEEEGRRVATERGAEFELDKQTGEVRQKDSHGNDPSDVPG